MASRPHFDLNRKEDIAENGFNFAIQAIYEPGSTFKIVATSGVLNEGLATPFTSVFCHNGLLQSKARSRCPTTIPMATLTFEGVLIKSSNIGAYKFARQLGIQAVFRLRASLGLRPQDRHPAQRRKLRHRPQHRQRGGFLPRQLMAMRST